MDELDNERRALIGRNIKTLRKRRGWSQEALASAVGDQIEGVSKVSGSTIYRAERGLPKVTVSMLRHIAATLDKTLEQLARPLDESSANLSPDQIIDRWCESVGQDRFFTHLPPTLGDDTPLPMASMYVELRIADELRASMAAREQLVPTFSIAHQQRRLYENRRARRLRVEDVFDVPAGLLQAVVLGDPGGGKSSMLKRLVLDIASGAMTRWKVPLFVSLARWWRSRVNARPGSSTLDLMTHVSASIVSAARVGPGNVSEQRSVYHGPHASRWGPQVVALSEALLERDDVLLLMDGFDEVAGDRDAVETVLDNLRRLGPRLSWVMTSRRAGFDGRLCPNRNERYELAELDAEGTHRLVQNWFRHQATSVDPDELLAWIAAGGPISQIAHNPFLLSLLCRIKRDAGERDLPTTRVGVYGEIFALARNHIRAQAGGDTRPSLSIQRCLARFCHWLYGAAPRSPRQLFGADDWEQFLVELPSGWKWMPSPPPDLNRDLLRARLLDRWGEEGDYHIVHLTLHEFLIAEDAASRCPDVLLDHLDDPIWREVIRFGAGLLWERGARARVEALVRALLEPPDLNGLRYVEGARLLADLPVRDTSALLGWDLRVRLWDVWREDTSYVSQAAAEALALLDPDWTVGRAIEVLQGKRALAIEDGETELYRALSAQGAMQTSLADPRLAVAQLLGSVATPEAVRALFALLELDDEPGLAGRAAISLTQIDDPVVREELRAWAAAPERTSAQHRVAAIAAREDRRSSWVPWLIEHLDHPDPSMVRLVTLALSLVRDSRAAEPLIACLNAPSASFEDYLDALMATPGEQADDWLHGCWNQAFEGSEVSHPVISLMIRGLVLRGSLLDEDLVELITVFVDDEDGEETLEQILVAIEDRTGQGIASEPVLIEALQQLRGRCDDTTVLETLCAIAATEAKLTSKTGLADLLLDSLSHTCPDVRASAANAIGTAAYATVDDVRQAEPLLRALVGDANQPIHVRSAAIGALGAWSSAAPETLELLESLVTNGQPTESDLRASAAEVLGNIDITWLGPWRSQPHVRRALAKVAAERGFLVFEHGYVDAAGQLVRWSRPDASSQ